MSVPFSWVLLFFLCFSYLWRFRPRANVELFVRRTKISEFDVRLFDLHMRPTKLINYKFGRNFIKSAPWSDSVDWFDASDVQRLTDDLNLRRPKTEFGSSHETFNVCPRPYRVRYARAIDLFTDMMSILNYLDLRSIMVCSGGISTIRYTRSVFTRPFPANFSLSFPRKRLWWERRSLCRVWMQ